VTETLFPPYRRIPDATYRLQFNRAFTFRDARRIAGYLHDLGISDIYASPYFRARAESTHGYDIADHNSLNPAIGGEADERAFVRELHARGMGQLLDFVPNHMGIGEPANAWWMDVLENGPSSLYAEFFDIDWQPLKPELHNKVLLPILGNQYGVVLENGELRLDFREGAFVIRYYDTVLPVAPGTATLILRRVAPAVSEALGSEHDQTLELLSIITGLENLPLPVQTARERKLERAREKEILKRRLAALHAASPAMRRALEEALAAFNGTPGDPASFDALDGLLGVQPYRLSFWRTAGEQINYRRFFDVNDLAAIRVENPAVFEASHRLVLRLLREGAVNGLRIDHPDGLWDPAGYFRRLQAAGQSAVGGRQLGDDAVSRLPTADCRLPAARPLYLLVEKILSGRERLPETWPVDGTTGYEFANAVNGIFVDRTNQRAFDEIYDEFTRTYVEYRTLVYEKKKLILTTALAGELNVLARQLDRIAEQSRRHRDFTLNSLTNALREVIACFPVYRTYISTEGVVDRHDRAAIDAAMARARRLNPAVEPSIFDFLHDILLMNRRDEAHSAAFAARVAFVMKFQQLTGPVMAKGVEDTAFYIYNRLVSLNEVGGEPDEFGVSVAAFHHQNQERSARWPHAMLTTSTHDTKRSEDVRARINVLSEIPERWSAALDQWRVLNRPKKVILHDGVAPDRNEEYLLYQTLLGAWPLQRMDRDAYAHFRGRIAAYMQKATKEAKVNTSWINPNAEYDEAVQHFVHAVLGETPDNAFVRALAPLLDTVARFGAYNSLAQTLLKLTAPGVPDTYQGNEIWDFSLVDPDNRRPVDYNRRRRLLRGLVRRIDAAGDDLVPLCRDLLARWRDGRIKLYLTHRALCFRRAHANLFREGDYTPLAAGGQRTDHLCAFTRGVGESRIVVAVPRLLVSMTPAGAHPLGAAVWGGTVLHVPGTRPGSRFRNVFTGSLLDSFKLEGDAALRVADLFHDFPVALLEYLPGQ
jgi:(1->4)-alpha-D-glucan 1-alpha-D-glucosylmutase